MEKTLKIALSEYESLKKQIADLKDSNEKIKKTAKVAVYEIVNFNIYGEGVKITRVMGTPHENDKQIDILLKEHKEKSEKEINTLSQTIEDLKNRTLWQRILNI